MNAPDGAQIMDDNRENDMPTFQDSETNQDVLSLGQRLRELRDGKQMSLEQVAMATRISVPFLQALEEDNRDALPGLVFGKGFVKILCRLYETEAADFLKAYDHQYGTSGKIEANCITRAAKSQIASSNRSAVWKNGLDSLNPKRYLSPTMLGILAGGGVIASILAGIVYLNTRGTPPRRPATKTETAATATTPPEAPIETPKEPQAAEPPAEEELASEQAIDPGSISVEISAATRIKWRTGSDGDWKVDDFKKGEHQLTFNQQLDLLIYDAGAVSISYLGRDLGVLGGKGRIRRLTFRQ